MAAADELTVIEFLRLLYTTKNDIAARKKYLELVSHKEILYSNDELPKKSIVFPEYFPGR